MKLCERFALGIMKKSFFGLALAVAVIITGLTGCSRSDRTISVADDDPAMLAAISKAREALPVFWEAKEKHLRGESGFALKVKISDGGKGEHFWLTEIERKEGKIFGVVNNEPETVRNVKLGERREIPEADISDWLFMRDRKMVGNYTLRVLFKQMPAKEVERYKAIMAEP
jgi:uncharacterized protein YegJ (DUF2314 family)